MKKTLLLSENFPPVEGGSGRWFWELYSRMPSDQVFVMSDRSDGCTHFDRSHNLSIIRTDMKSSQWGLRSVRGLRFYFRMVLEVRKLVKESNIEEIHCGRVIHEGVIAWFVSKLTGVPFICFVHGEDVETAATSREQSFLVRLVCQASKLIICNSHNSQRLVKELGFQSGDKCKVLHPGVDSSRFVSADRDDSFRKRMGWDGKRVLLTVGRLQQRKGQDFLLKALPRLLEQYPDLFYAIVGRGECHETLNEYIESENLKENAAIYTELGDEELIKCYQQCDIFILPNRTIGNDIEGFGMVLVEAQCCGKPVIAGDSGGTNETMLIDETGYIIDCSSVSSLATHLNIVLQNKNLQEVGKKAETFASQKFNWDKHVVKAKELFNACQ